MMMLLAWFDLLLPFVVRERSEGDAGLSVLGSALLIMVHGIFDHFSVGSLQPGHARGRRRHSTAHQMTVRRGCPAWSITATCIVARL